MATIPTTATCAYCKELVDKNLSVQTEKGKTKKYYHSECYDEMMMSGNSPEDYKAVHDYLDQHIKAMNLSKPTQTATWTLVAVKLENIRKKFNLTYKGVELTLKYILEVCEFEFDEQTIGLVPYKYYEARGYYEEQRKLDKQLANIDMTTIIQNRRVVEIEPPTATTYEDYEPVDISAIDINNDDIDDIW